MANHYRLIDTCMNNDRFGEPNAWKSRLPLVAFRSLAMQASIIKSTKYSFRTMIAALPAANRIGLEKSVVEEMVAKTVRSES